MTTPDGFFTELGNTKPYMKIAFEGFAGCGKTFTMAQLAAGLHKRIGSEKPIVIFDTEHAAKFLKRFFQEKGIRVLHKESRSLADLKKAMAFCAEGGSDVLMIDSISHVWEDFLNSYKRNKKKNQTKLEFQDWGIIKPTWKAEFSDPFVRDPYHTLMTGRAAFEYEDEKDENGNRQIFKSGIKMKVEGETAYEPDILVLMSRKEDILGDAKEVWREATIIKDRSTLIDGKTFRNPTYEDFAPSVDYILEAPESSTLPAETDAATLFTEVENDHEWRRRRDIALEEIEGEMTKAWPGQSADAKRAKVVALEAVFGTTSWKKVESMSASRLEGCLISLREFVKKTNESAATAAS